MAKAEAFCEVEFDTDKNANWVFRPLRRRIRGRFDVLRCTEPNAGKLRNLWPEPIPGQRLRIDFNEKAASIIEPLQHDSNSSIRERIERQGMSIAKNERFDAIDVATWVYWVRCAVEAGKARIIAGTLPEQSSFDEQPSLRFYSIEPRRDKSEEILERLTVALEALAKR